MKQKFSVLLLTMLVSIVGTDSYAYDFSIKNSDGVLLYYKYINDAQELQVTNDGHGGWWGEGCDYYVGDIVIPQEVTYMNRTRTVTSIDSMAFFGCNRVTSITIPQSVTSIGGSAFSYCSGLTSISIPNNVISAGSGLFYGCRGLTSVNLGNGVNSLGNATFKDCKNLTSVNIGNNLKSIGNEVFYGCSKLTSITIPPNVTSIGRKSFYNCTSLTSIIVPDNVTSIGEEAFYYCQSLISAIIGNGVTKIGQRAFYCCSKMKSMSMGNSVIDIATQAFCNCDSLTSVIIPNNVTSIGERAFENCRSLVSLTIGGRLTSIADNAFNNADITTVISLIENPFKIRGKNQYYGVFSINTYNNATLYVPVGTKDKYKATEGWKDFMFIEEGDGGGDNPPELSKCEKPTIGYQNGKLTFHSATEGATCQSTITDTDITSYSSNEVQLSVTYNISVYATKAGYGNSETVTATLCWIDIDPKTEGIENSVVQVRASAVLIQTESGNVSVNGVDDGTKVSVYNTNGVLSGTAISRNGSAAINTSLQTGSVAIIKIGEKSVKVIIK